MPGISIKRFFYDWVALAQSKSLLIDILITKLNNIKNYLSDIIIGQPEFPSVPNPTISRLGEARLGTFRLGFSPIITLAGRTDARLGIARLGTFRLGEFTIPSIPRTTARLGQARLGAFRLGEEGQGVIGLTYQTDLLIKKLNIQKSYLSDLILSDINNQKTTIVDSFFKKLGIFKMYTSDTIIISPETRLKAYLTDLLFRGQRTKNYTLDSIYKRLALIKTYNTNFIVSSKSIKEYFLDVIFRKFSEGETEIISGFADVLIKEKDKDNKLERGDLN